MNIHDKFEAVNDEFRDFDKVENKRAGRADLHAFILLDELFPGAGDIICACDYEEYYLNIREDQIEQLTDDQILELVRCGVIHDDEHDSLRLFA
ncbi:hypothetical protein KAR91_72945 [Candidatus Pacearchaeota archaeon]|nr:hypothetical protein [Candidatus Pacearchaeota archaeon]